MFKFLRPLLAFLAATALPVVQAYADPGACSGACWAHDPSVIQRTSDGLYFKFNTGSGMEIATASSLSGPWTLKGYVLPSGSSININGGTDLWVRIFAWLYLWSDANSCFWRKYVTEVINTGPRCAQSRKHLLPLLLCIDLRFPNLRNWSRNVFNNGAWKLDR